MLYIPNRTHDTTSRNSEVMVAHNLYIITNIPQIDRENKNYTNVH